MPRKRDPGVPPAPAAPVGIISPDLLREAAAFAAQHDRPLLRRLLPDGTPAGEACVGPDEPVILAFYYGQYRFEAEEERTGVLPRRAHLEWVEEQLRDGEVPPSLARTLSRRRLRTLVQRAEAGLDARTYARACGGPTRAAELEAWLDKPYDIREEEELDVTDEYLVLMRRHSPGYDAFERVLESSMPHLPLRHPDTGEEIGDVSTLEGMYEITETKFADGHALVTCLQWAADLASIPLRVAVVQEGADSPPPPEDDGWGEPVALDDDQPNGPAATEGLVVADLPDAARAPDSPETAEAPVLGPFQWWERDTRFITRLQVREEDALTPPIPRDPGQKPTRESPLPDPGWRTLAITRTSTFERSRVVGLLQVMEYLPMRDVDRHFRLLTVDHWAEDRLVPGVVRTVREFTLSDLT